MRWLIALVLGSSLTPRPLPERAKLADRVAVVQVLKSSVELRGGDVRKMFTHTEVLVGDVLKGPQPAPGIERLTITQLGGRSGLWESHVPGDATFAPGETALVLLRCSPTPNQCGLVGLAEGKVTLIGNDAFVFDLATNRHLKRPVADVLAEVRAAVKGGQGGSVAPAGAPR
ncbi:MAG: hypothetical protein IPJ65_23230 [Archangiaceae bacterium]|nr:hypothetical protein [Archangiaceae bacterium]